MNKNIGILIGSSLVLFLLSSISEANSAIIKLELPLPQLSVRIDAMMPFDVKTSATRAWVSGQSFIVKDPGNSDNGPLLLWERTNSGFEAVKLPETSIAYYPELCAVSDTEAYVTFLDDPNSIGRIFSRQGNPDVGFTEQTAPILPTGFHFSFTHLSCFANGNLWLYGSAQQGDDVAHQLPYIFHRSTTSGSWENIPIPDGVSPSGGGVDGALLRPDGSGFYFIVKKLREVSIYERDPHGKWTEVLILDPTKVLQVLQISGDPDRNAVAAVFSTSTEARYLKLEGKNWKLMNLGTDGRINATGVSGDNLYLGGSFQSQIAILTIDSIKPMVPTFPGDVYRMTFESNKNKGFAIIGGNAGIYQFQFDSMK